jgi:phage terminase small subunit
MKVLAIRLHFVENNEMNLDLKLGTDLQRRFIVEYPADFNATQAAIRAGYAPTHADRIGSRLLGIPRIVAAIEKRQQELAARAALTVDWVLNEWREIASADPSEIIYSRLECCRHCYGVGHRYQWTEFEYAQAVEIALAHRCGSKCKKPCEIRVPPDGLGGFGFSPHIGPAANCPVCHGDGYERVMLSDIRKLKGPARRLFAGIKKTKEGVEVKFRDQDGALKNIASFLGMMIERKQIGGPGGGPIPVAHLTARDLTDDQLAAYIAANTEPKIIDATIEPE